MRYQATYYIPGSFLSEEIVRPLDERSVHEALWKAPCGAFAFTLHDLADPPPDLGPEYHVSAVPQNASGRYYIDGEKFTLAEVESWGDQFKVLASNMRSNDWSTIVKCRTGNYQPLERGDRIIPSIEERGQ